MSPSSMREGARLPLMSTMREFSPRDVVVIRKITQEALAEDYPLSLFLDIHASWPEGFMVIELDEEVIAFIAGILPTKHQSRILMLAVRDEFRNQGIGSALMDEFTVRCLARKVSSIELEVRKSNAGAIRFYERLGFTIRYLLPRFYTDGEDGCKMWKSFR